MAASPALPVVPAATAISVPWPQVERFVGLFAHDLRNGLNTVELQLTLLGEISDDPEVKAEVKRVRASVADVTRQLHAVRLATGVPTPRAFAYPVGDFVEDLRERFDRQHPEAAAQVDWEMAAGAGSLSVDPELSMTALLELLENSLRFAVDGSRIRVQTDGGASGLTFSIHETLASAPPIPPDEWGRMPLTSTRRDGYGLGAFRARRIIETQNGTLDFTYSETERSLATTVTLPAAPAGNAAN